MKTETIVDRFKINFDYIFEIKPTIWAVMVGQSFTAGDYWDITIDTEAIDTTGFTLKVSSQASKIDWIAICMFAVNSDRAYSFTKTVNGGPNHHWA